MLSVLSRRAAPRTGGCAGLTLTRHTGMEIFGIPYQALFGQLMLGLVNGSFYAMLSLGLAVIFGLLNIINFAHGALYMLGAFLAWIMLNNFGINYWLALLAGAADRGRARRDHRTPDPQAPVQARPAVRPAADLRPGADRSKACSATTSASRASPTPCPKRCGRHQPGLHGPAELPRLGGVWPRWWCAWAPGS